MGEKEFRLNFEPWALEVLRAYLSALKPPKSKEEAWARARGGLCWWLNRYLFRTERWTHLELHEIERELVVNLFGMFWAFIDDLSVRLPLAYADEEEKLWLQQKAKMRWEISRSKAIRLCDLLLELHKKAREGEPAK